MIHKRIFFTIANATAIVFTACAKNDAVNSETTAMTVDSSAGAMVLHMDSLRIADSLRLDSAMRADSVRIVDTLSNKH